MTRPTELDAAIARLERTHGRAEVLPTSERRALAIELGLPPGRALIDVGRGRVASVDVNGASTLHKRQHHSAR